MKDIVSFINEGSLEYPMKGVLKKNDKVTIIWLDTNQKPLKITDVENAKVDKVVSMALARYRDDYHTWAYVNGVRFELRAEMKDQYLGLFDRNYSKNPRNKFAIICTPEQADKLVGDNGELNMDD